MAGLCYYIVNAAVKSKPKFFLVLGFFDFNNNGRGRDFFIFFIIIVVVNVENEQDQNAPYDAVVRGDKRRRIAEHSRETASGVVRVSDVCFEAVEQSLQSNPLSP